MKYGSCKTFFVQPNDYISVIQFAYTNVAIT